jgi:hypothetical protein
MPARGTAPIRSRAISLPRSDDQPGTVICVGRTSPLFAPIFLDQPQQLLGDWLVRHLVKQLVEAALEPNVKRSLEVLGLGRAGMDSLILPLLHGEAFMSLAAHQAGGIRP